MILIKNLWLSACAGLLVGCSPQVQKEQVPKELAPKQNPATLYVNGDILSMDEAHPNPQSFATRNGIIIAQGTRDDVEATLSPPLNIIDLQGQTILPGFIDAHGHLTYTNILQLYTSLAPPPVGGVRNMNDLVAVMQAHGNTHPDENWIIGFGYDDSLLAEKRHPTRADLDQVSTERPVVAIHVSGHLRACNTVCLDMAGISAKTADPAGGIIRRIGHSQEPDGVLEETAMGFLKPIAPKNDIKQRVSLIEKTQLEYASYGVTTIQDGAANTNNLKVLSSAAEAGKLFLDVVAFPHMSLGIEKLKQYPVSKTYQNHYRIGGIKLSLDGSPQGKTAWLSTPYHVAPHGQSKQYRGYATLNDAQAQSLIDYSFENDVPVLAHANGDAAADQMIKTIQSANKKYGTKDRRPVMIHAQTVRDDQIVAMKQSGILPSYFVAHTFFWGDWHRDSVLGQKRASRISPLKSSHEHGLKYTIHNDTPVVPADMMRLLWTAVNRKTRSGKTLGEGQKVSAMQGLKAITINVAYQYFEEDSKGSISVGKKADLVILDQNPTLIDPDKIKDIKVMQTIKDGKTVYRRAALKP